MDNYWPEETLVVKFIKIQDAMNTNYTIWIDDERYKGIVECGETLGEALQQLGISLHVKQLYDEGDLPSFTSQPTTNNGE